jgi:hypothetical protein
MIAIDARAANDYFCAPACGLSKPHRQMPPRGAGRTLNRIDGAGRQWLFLAVSGPQIFRPDNSLSSCRAKACWSLALNEAGPPVSTPDERRVSMKLRRVRAAAMLPAS